MSRKPAFKKEKPAQGTKDIPQKRSNAQPGRYPKFWDSSSNAGKIPENLSGH